MLSTAVILTLAACGDDAEDDAPRVIENNAANNVNNVNNVNNANNANNVNNVGTNNSQTNNVARVSGSIDIVVDTNRDGRLDLETATDELGEEKWTQDSGAVFLPNIDDDDESCPRTNDDIAMSKCFDGADEELDGPLDLLDLAPLTIRSIDALSPDVRGGTLEVSLGQEHIRLFDMKTQERVMLPADLDLEQLADGIELGVEGKDVVRDASWDGIVEIRVVLDWEEAPEGADVEDTVQLRVAPLILRHHLDPATTIYSSELAVGGDGAFTRDLTSATRTAGVSQGHVEFQVYDQWAQDYFETGYVAAPSEDGLHVIEVFIRSANIEVDQFGRGYLREAGRVVYDLAGPDRAAMFALSPDDHTLEWDSLNSFGNTETIPPYAHDGATFPVGRILRGEGNGDRGDGAMRKLFEAQRIQDPLWVPTGWLFVGHVDETISFVSAPTARGWVMLVNDARLARTLLEQVRNQDVGSTMFEGKAWLDFNGRESSAAVDLAQTLEDPDIMSANAEAMIEVDAQVRIIKAATGLKEEEIIPVPFLHQDYNGYSVAYQPGMVNGLVPARDQFWAPRPHGPQVDGVDVMEEAFESALAPFGINVTWVEDWDMFHRLYGEVHCGSNVLRAKPTSGWWEPLP